jgi:hypothetical protein
MRDCASDDDHHGDISIAAALDILAGEINAREVRLVQ